MTPAGVEPATFRFVAQRLNHCATAVPFHSIVRMENLLTRKVEVSCQVLSTRVCVCLCVCVCVCVLFEDAFSVEFCVELNRRMTERRKTAKNLEVSIHGLIAFLYRRFCGG